jgi:hypothetical protein
VPASVLFLGRTPGILPLFSWLSLPCPGHAVKILFRSTPLSVPDSCLLPVPHAGLQAHTLLELSRFLSRCALALAPRLCVTHGYRSRLLLCFPPRLVACASCSMDMGHQLHPVLQRRSAVYFISCYRYLAIISILPLVQKSAPRHGPAVAVGYGP